MRMLMGLHALPPDSVGGTEQVALTLARGLAAQMHVTVFAPLSSALLPVGTETLQRTETAAGSLTVVGRRLHPARSFRDSFDHPEALPWLERLLEQDAPQLCHLHHLAGLSLRFPPHLRARGIPCVLTLHDYWLVCGRGQLVDLGLQVCGGPSPLGCRTCLADQVALAHPVGRMVRTLLDGISTGSPRVEHIRRYTGVMADAYTGLRSRFEKQISRMGLSDIESRSSVLQERLSLARDALGAASVVTAPSADLLRRFHHWGLPLPRPRTIRNRLPGLEADPQELATPAPAPVAPPPLRLLFVGALLPTKAPDILLEALAGLPPGQVEATLVGPALPFHRAPDYLSTVRARARQPGIRLLGVCSPLEVQNLMRSHHLLVLPSIWPENAPLVLEEAFAVGLPVLASAIGGIPERLEHGINGLLLPPGSVSALRQALLELLHAPERLEILSAGARASALTPDGWLEPWWDAYRTALAAPHDHAPARDSIPEY